MKKIIRYDKEVKLMYRQGDILLKKIKKTELGTKTGEHEKVLAEGEVTGHKHIMRGSCAFYEKDGKVQVQVEREAELTHEEHATIMIPRGTYRVVRQREVNLLGEIRKVSD